MVSQDGPGCKHFGDERRPQVRHVAFWGLILPLVRSTRFGVTYRAVTGAASLNPRRAVHDSSAQELWATAASSDLAAGPSVFELLTNCLPVVCTLSRVTGQLNHELATAHSHVLN